MNKLLLSCYVHLLCMYPGAFGAHYEREMRLFIRVFARERGLFALSILLFSDLLISVPQQHYYEARMKYSRHSVALAVVGTCMLMAAATQVIYDLARPDLRMGFPLILLLTSDFVIGMWMIDVARHGYVS